MLFRFLLGLSALLVAGSAAYFSVLGIASLFSGSYYQVIVMAGALEFGKLIATSFLYRYWEQTIAWLKIYLVSAVVTLMAITSLGIFGFLSAAYQENATKLGQFDTQIALIEQQKETVNSEITQNKNRIDTLNAARKTQEQRLPTMSRTAAAPVYEDMARAAEEIQKLTTRSQELQTLLFEKDSNLIELNSKATAVKDIGTFKFIANTIDQPLDNIVIIFICILIFVFDPLAVGLVLAFNVATYGATLRKTNKVSAKEEIQIPVKKEKPITEKEAVKETLNKQETPVKVNLSTPSSVLVTKGHIVEKH